MELLKRGASEKLGRTSIVERLSSRYRPNAGYSEERKTKTRALSKKKKTSKQSRDLKSVAGKTTTYLVKYDESGAGYGIAFPGREAPSVICMYLLWAKRTTLDCPTTKPCHFFPCGRTAHVVTTPIIGGGLSAIRGIAKKDAPPQNFGYHR